MDTRGKVAGIAALVIALGLLVVPKVVPPCTDLVTTAAGGQMPMRCFYTFRAQTLFALASVAAALGLFLVGGRDGRKALGGMLVVLGIMMLLLPVSGVIGLCRMDGMPCHHTAFWHNLLSAAQVLAGLLVVFLPGQALSSSPVIKEMPPAAGEKTKWLD